MTIIGALAVTGIVIAGAYWVLTNVTFRKDDKDDNG